MKRTTFLPLFFTALVVVFGIAVWVRLGAYGIANDMATPETASAGETEVSTGVSEPPAETGTIVDVPTATQETAAAASARQQRYNELLRNPPPSPPIAPPGGIL